MDFEYDEQATIEHVHPHCTGAWKLRGNGDNQYIECDVCKKRFDATADNRLAAIDENHAGFYLRQLAAEGEIQIRLDTQN